MRNLQHGVWVAVCDGSRAMLLENAGNASTPNLLIREAQSQENPPTRNQGTDTPGRAFSGANGRRAAVEQTDFHDQAEREFLRSFARRIDQRLADSTIHALVLVAPPRALGMLRPELSGRVSRAVRAELARDYVKMPVHEIERMLLADLAKGDSP
jgi:protein required for attachment to host cells